MGFPYSNRCVGTSEADAWMIYYNAPIGTPVIFQYDLQIVNSNRDTLKQLHPKRVCCRLMKKPKQGFARDFAIFSKKCLLAVAALEDVFVEYAFELAMPAEKRSAPRVGAEAAKAQAD